MTEQPEALRLADALDRGTYLLSRERQSTAAELRRLNEVNAKLLEALKELVDIVDGAISDRSTGDMDSYTLQPARAAIAKAEGKT